MRFLLAFVLSFVSVFAIAQAPPMKVGGPQGIDVTRLLSRDWLSVPIYIDTPVAPLTGSGWPGAAYLIQSAKNYKEATLEDWVKWSEAGGLTQLDSIRWQDNAGTIYFLPKGIDTSQVLDYMLYGDTSVWHYTGKKWRRVGGNAEFYFDYLLDGGYVTQVSPVSSRQFLITPADYYLGGVRYKYDTTFRIQAPPKAVDSTGRIDVIFLSTTGPRLARGTPSRLPVKPQVRSGAIELASIYFRPFDSIPSVVGARGDGVSSIYRIPGKDSIYYIVDTLTFAIKDSIGISKNDTAAMLNNYKFTVANGLTKDSTVFRLGGSLNQNTNINLSTRRLTFIGGTDTTRFFSNGRVSIGGRPDSSFMFNVNGNAKVENVMRVVSGRIVYGTDTSDVPLVIRKGWGGATTPGVNIGFNTLMSNNTNSYMVSDRTELTGGSNTVNVMGYQNNIDSSSSCTVIGGGNNIPNPSSHQLIIGYSNTSNSYTNTQNASIVIGLGNNTNGYWGGGLIGSGLKYYDNGQLAFGGNSNNVNFATRNVYFGNGVKNENNNLNANFGHGPDVAINPSWANDVDSINRNGGSLTIAGGRGTGTGTPGTVRFSTWNTTTSGSTLHPTLTERARITPIGNLLVGTTTDSIYKLDVNGDSRVTGAIHQRFGADSASYPFSQSVNILTGNQQPQSRRGILIGNGTFNNTNNVSIGIGTGVNVGTGTSNIAIGYTSSASGGSIAIGSGGNTASATSGGIAIGQGANANSGVAMGDFVSTANGGVGISGNATGTNSVAIGVSSSTNGNRGIAIGSLSSANNSNSIAIGWFTNTTAANQLVIGGNDVSNGYGISDVFIGSGVRNAAKLAGKDVTYNGSGAGDSSNMAGGNIRIAGGKGTGNGTPGAVIFSTSTSLPNAADTTTLQTLSERARINQNGNLLVGTSIDNGYRISAITTPGGSIVNGVYARGYTPLRADYINDGNTIFAAGGGDSCAVVVRHGSIGNDVRVMRIFGARAGDEIVVNNTTGNYTNQDTTAILRINSTGAGFLQPRMTNVERDSISSRPTTGLQIFSTTDSANYVYRGTGGGWQKIANEISGSATLDFPSTNNGNESDLTITVTGASEGDVVSLGIPNSVNLNHSCFTAWVSATNTVTVRFNNYGTGALNPVSATFKVKVFK